MDDDLTSFATLDDSMGDGYCSTPELEPNIDTAKLQQMSSNTSTSSASAIHLYPISN
jgi:hypothetical protein